MTIYIETDCAYRRLPDMSAGIIDRKNFYEAAKIFVDAYEKCELSEDDERELPQLGELYRDIFGNEYLVLSVLSKEVSDGKPIIVLMDMKSKMVFTLPLEDFLNPQFSKE